MKDLEIKITMEGRFYHMTASCQYSDEAQKIVLDYFGCCHIDGEALTTGLVTQNPFKLIEAQTYLLSK